MCPEVRGKRTAPSTLVIRVSYQAVTFAQMIAKLTAAMADKTLNATLKHYAKWDVLIVDEFGFDRIPSVPTSVRHFACAFYLFIRAPQT